MELKISWHGNVLRQRRYKLDEYAFVQICDDIEEKENRITMLFYTSKEEGYKATIRSFGLYTTGMNKDHYNHKAIFGEEDDYNNTCEFLDSWEHAERVE